MEDKLKSKASVSDDSEYHENEMRLISENGNIAEISATRKSGGTENTISDFSLLLSNTVTIPERQSDNKEFKNVEESGLENKMSDLESALECVGSFGRYQKCLAAFLWLLVSPFLAFVIYGNMLILLTPNHWCQVPELSELGLTTVQRKNLSIPMELDEGVKKFSQCGKYSVNFTQISKFHRNVTLPGPSPDWQIAKCHSTWEYDYTFVYPTVASEGNWVCDNAWKTYLVYTAFWTGTSLGVIILGFIADTFGRKPVVVVGHLLCALSGIATNYVTNYKLFLFVRFLVGFFTISQSMTSYVLVMEYVGTKHRLVVSTGFLFTYPLIGCILPWLAYVVRDWKTFNLMTSIPLLAIPLLYKFIPESLRWMSSKGNHVKVKQMLRNIAKFNKKSVPHDFFDEVKLLDENETKKKGKTVLDLIRLPNLRRVFMLTNITWLSLSSCFTGGYIYAATISDNPFLMITVNSGLDILSNILADRLADRYGRRATAVCCSFLASLAYFCSAISSKESYIAETASLMVARLFVTVSHNVNYLYAAEVYPTVVRTQALAVRQAIGSAGNFLSPQVVLLALIAKFIPLLIFGGLSAIAALAMMPLPETSNSKLPETLEDGENLARTGRSCASIFSSKDKKLSKFSEKSSAIAKRKLPWTKHMSPKC